MKISWYGQSLFHISSRTKKSQVSISINPFKKEVGLKTPTLKTDILLSGNKENHNLDSIKNDFFLIDNPGEYEVKGVFIEGIPTFNFKNEKKEDPERSFDGNTIYTIEVDGIKVCHLGNIKQKELKEDQLERIGMVDILMVPVGGEDTLTAKEAIGIIGQIEPGIIIPMQYAVPKLKIKLDKVDDFLKLSKAEDLKPIEKLVIKKSEIDSEQPKIITLSI